MCSVVGVSVLDVQQKQLDLIVELFHQSAIRGKHATGIAYVIDDQINYDIYSKSADKVINKKLISKCLTKENNLYLIGHCRYSTSDLKYNQPIVQKTKALVHNGVISQELPEKWKSLYGYDCKTKNDSELMLHSDNPLLEFSNASISAIELYADQTVIAYRNGKRPLYYNKLSNGYIITSTADISVRSGLLRPLKLEMNTYFKIKKDLSVKKQIVDIPDSVDLQRKYRTV